MELLVVTGEDLFRAGGRLSAVLSRGHNAMMLSHRDFNLSAPPGPEVGVIFLGTEATPTADPLARTLFADHGVSIVVHGSHAWIQGLPVDDPRSAVKPLGDALERLSRVAPMRQNPMADKSTPRNGAEYASLFLNPRLRVPTQTVASGFTFSSERMVWERQYTFGIAHFLAAGFDSWHQKIGVR